MEDYSTLSVEVKNVREHKSRGRIVVWVDVCNGAPARMMLVSLKVGEKRLEYPVLGYATGAIGPFPSPGELSFVLREGNGKVRQAVVQSLEEAIYLELKLLAPPDNEWRTAT